MRVDAIIAQRGEMHEAMLKQFSESLAGSTDVCIRLDAASEARLFAHIALFRASVSLIR